MIRQLSTNIDAVNIGLMLLALIPALLMPFELFLIVYAVLGPLHYLTEINWLHKKNYFTTHRHDYLLIVFFIAVIAVLSLFKSAFSYYIPLLTFTAFTASFGLIFFADTRKKIMFTLLCACIGLLLFSFFYAHFRILFSILLPTIIHVFIFTGVFILLGALRTKNKWGVASVAVFVFCAAITLFAGTFFKFDISDYIYDSHATFRRLNQVLMKFFSLIHSDDIKLDLQVSPRITQNDIPIYFSETGIKIMRFIAFAYTYHYLNWFSKTSVIQWHNTKRINLILIVAIWGLSLALYLYDYRTGLKWLYLLSFGHVLLEFPLNHRSFIDIKNQFVLKFSR